MAFMAEESDGGTPCVEVLLEESSFLCSRLDDIIDVPEELVDKAVKLALGQVCCNSRSSFISALLHTKRAIIIRPQPSPDSLHA